MNLWWACPICKVIERTSMFVSPPFLHEHGKMIWMLVAYKTLKEAMERTQPRKGHQNYEQMP